MCKKSFVLLSILCLFVLLSHLTNYDRATLTLREGDISHLDTLEMNRVKQELYFRIFFSQPLSKQSDDCTGQWDLSSIIEMGGPVPSHGTCIWCVHGT